MTLDRVLPAGTEDFTGAEFMDELKGEVERLWQYGLVPLVSVLGTNTITASAEVGLTAYANGVKATLVPLNSVGSGGVTLNVNSLGAKTVYDYKGDPLGQNALVAGRAYLVEFFSADDGWRVMSGTGGLGTVLSAAVIVANQQTNGTAGGGATAGSYQTYTLNTVVVNDLSGEGASLSTNQVTLPPGTYDVWASVPFNITGNSRLQLYNVTDGAAVSGLSSTTVRATTLNEIKGALLVGRFTITASKALELRYRVTSTRATDGLGTASSFTEVEQYGVLQFLRLAEGGVDGEGVISGGTTGQALAKASATDFDTEWVDVVAGGNGVNAIVRLTQAAFDALGTPDANTLYVIYTP